MLVSVTPKSINPQDPLDQHKRVDMRLESQDEQFQNMQIQRSVSVAMEAYTPQKGRKRHKILDDNNAVQFTSKEEVEARRNEINDHLTKLNAKYNIKPLLNNDKQLREQRKQRSLNN